MASPVRTFIVIALSALVLQSNGVLTQQRRQSVPTVLPGTWSSKGCYTDVSSARTLSSASYTSSSMTVESCLAFCTNGGYNYAGVEYGRECYCGFAIQNSGTPIELTECNTACTGDSLQSCGASNRINVYYDGSPSPAVVQAIGSWKYKGCYNDSPTARALAQRVDVSGGLTAAKCTAACKSNGYSFSGLEYAAECWCGHVLINNSKNPETDCQMICTGDRTQICGGPNRLSLYEDEGAPPLDPQTCIQTSNPRLNLLARDKNVPTTVNPIRIIDVHTVPKVGYSILSTCTGCSSAWEYIDLSNGVLFPTFPNNQYLKTVSFSLLEGESPSFISIQGGGPARTGYCLSVNLVDSTGPLILSGDRRSDLWSLCPNSTAGGRLDVVWSAKANHAHYIKSNCREVYLEGV